MSTIVVLSIVSAVLFGVLVAEIAYMIDAGIWRDIWLEIRGERR